MVLTQTVQNNRTYWYRVWAIGAVVGDTATAGFPTMSADSVSNTAVIRWASRRRRQPRLAWRPRGSQGSPLR